MDQNKIARLNFAVEFASLLYFTAMLGYIMFTHASVAFIIIMFIILICGAYVWTEDRDWIGWWID